MPSYLGNTDLGACVQALRLPGQHHSFGYIQLAMTSSGTDYQPVVYGLVQPHAHYLGHCLQLLLLLMLHWLLFLYWL
jgi:hypothetical protein